MKFDPRRWTWKHAVVFRFLVLANARANHLCSASVDVMNDSRSPDVCILYVMHDDGDEYES
jgi:hypothetical protein